MDAAERFGREAERRGCPSISVLSMDEFHPVTQKFQMKKKLSLIRFADLFSHALEYDNDSCFCLIQSELPNKEAVILVVSTAGQGENPDSMKVA